MTVGTMPDVDAEQDVWLRRVRFVAWTVAIVSWLVVAAQYDTLPSTMPLTRWTSAPKTWVTALRVPTICVVSLGLVESLGGAVRRVPDFDRGSAFTAILLLTAAWKAAAAAAGLLLLPRQVVWFEAVWAGATLAGIAAAVWAGKDLLRGGGLRTLTWSRTEKTYTLALAVALVALQLPLLGAAG